MWEPQIKELCGFSGHPEKVLCFVILSEAKNLSSI